MSINNAITRLQEVLGDRVSTSKADLEIHGQNETHFDFSAPDAVVYPENTDEVSKTLAICHENGCPVVGWGTGTSLEGHAVPIKGGISLDMSRMDKVLEVNPEDMDVRVQPGLRRVELKEELRTTGLFFPIDPGANASIGGMAATRASGTAAVKYGTMRENVLALEVVLADGRIIRTGSRAKKSSAGYDLTHLFVGSEGTLGIITELTLRLHGQPEAISSAICAFDDEDAAINAVITTIQHGIPMARIEYLDAPMAKGFNVYSGADFPEKPHLLLEFHGSESGVKEQAERVGEIVKELGGSDFQWSSKTEERNALWKMRHDAAYAGAALRPGSAILVTDICVPISRLAEAIRETRKDIEASGLQGPIVGHVGDGNFHSSILIEPGNADEKKIALDLAHRMAKRSLELGGTITGEHGVGMGKLDLMEAEHGEAWQVMAAIKRTMDPENIMNPGKIVRIN